MEHIKKILDFVDSNNLYPELKIVQEGAFPEVTIENKKVLMFSSNNYLGLAVHPRIIKAAEEATKKYGAGADGSRMLSGNLQIHRDFEIAIAKFKGGEDAIMWPTGYSANVGVITAVMNPPKIGPQDFIKRRGVIFSDELNHASIIDGCKMSGQKIVVFKHRDVDDLQGKLRKYSRRDKKLIVTDGVFSMDGDIAPLDKLAELAKEYSAWLMTDEARSTGILGKNGHGTLEHFGLKAGKDVHIVLGTCSKALAANGGFVVGDKDLVRYLRITSRSYIFSTANVPAVSASLIEALNVIETEPQIRKQLWKNVKKMGEGFRKIGFDTLTSETQIIPILIGKDEKAMQFTKKLFSLGIFGPAVRWPAVAKDSARIRFAVMAIHTPEQIDYLLKSCEEVGKELNLIQ